MEKKIIIGVIVSSFLLILVSYFFIKGSSLFSKSSDIKIITYKKEDKEKPKVSYINNFKDLGIMKVSEERSADFIIKNTGQKNLQLFNISSSCGCTVGKIIIDKKESKEFGMHSRSDYVGEVLPGQQAIVKVIYRPYVMPIYGVVEREVYVTTNDPENERLVFKVKAFVK